MITNVHKAAINRTWRAVVPVADTVADLFYRRLFELRPEYRKLFPADLTEQKKKLLDMLGFVVKSLDWADENWRDSVPSSDDLFLVVLALGRRHAVDYHVPEEAYEPTLDALMYSLETGLGSAFDPSARDAWSKVFGLIAHTMKLGPLMPSDAPAGAA